MENTAETPQLAVITCRMYTPEDYSTLETWWKQQNWPPVPADMLPTIGIIACIEDKPVCAGFLYTSNSLTVWMEWMIADPATTKEDRNLALNTLVENLLTYADLQGAKYIMTSIMHPKLVQRLEDRGFIKTDANMTNMIYVIKR